MFEAGARLGAIGAAARELDVSQAAVSQQLKTLETFLGSQLFDRSQRGVTLTPSAQHYLPVVRGVLHHLIAQTQILFGEQQDAVLRLKVNHSIAYNWLMPRLADFTNRYPFIRLDMTLVDWPSGAVSGCRCRDYQRLSCQRTYSRRAAVSGVLDPGLQPGFSSAPCRCAGGALARCVTGDSGQRLRRDLVAWLVISIWYRFIPRYSWRSPPRYMRWRQPDRGSGCCWCVRCMRRPT